MTAPLTTIAHNENSLCCFASARVTAAVSLAAPDPRAAVVTTNSNSSVAPKPTDKATICVLNPSRVVAAFSNLLSLPMDIAGTAGEVAVARSAAVTPNPASPRSTASEALTGPIPPDGFAARLVSALISHPSLTKEGFSLGQRGGRVSERVAAAPSSKGSCNRTSFSTRASILRRIDISRRTRHVTTEIVTIAPTTTPISNMSCLLSRITGASA